MTKQTKPLNGGPTKRFFVDMLTRDITLVDAILDLLDNCVDGAARQTKGRQKDAKPYKGFEASLILTSTTFEISDNCGGISEERIYDAFLLGRPKVESGLSTIGVYGIGMKRAIFKIGKEASVQSWAKDGAFAVNYDRDWLNPDNENWDLPFNEVRNRRTKGVSIVIPKLREGIGREFGNDKFINDLRLAVAENFGYLMQKGFSVKINGKNVIPQILRLHTDLSAEKGIKPYIYQADEDDVRIQVSIGFYRPLAKMEETDEEAEKNTDGNQAGISVICNDRLVLIKDRTLKTGWGDGSVPNYHPQFRCISGLIIFTTDNPIKLPVSTTKRDLDVGSDIYLQARQSCMEGLREFITFTNRWKGMEEEANKFFDKARLEDARSKVALTEANSIAIRGNKNARRNIIKLPLPETRNPVKRIAFARKESEIRTVSEYLFGEADESPTVVGQECFDRLLKSKRK